MYVFPLWLVVHTVNCTNLHLPSIACWNVENLHSRATQLDLSTHLVSEVDRPA